MQSGGSARTWKQWYDDALYYVGVDINPRTKRTESAKESVFVELGSQMNESFLAAVCARHGL